MDWKVTDADLLGAGVKVKHFQTAVLMLGVMLAGAALTVSSCALRRIPIIEKSAGTVEHNSNDTFIVCREGRGDGASTRKIYTVKTKE